MFSGHRAEGLGFRICRWQEIVDGAVGVAVDDLGEHVGEIEMRVDAAEFAIFDQRGDNGPIVTSAIGAGEERVLAIERDGPDRTFDRVGVDLNATVVKESGETFPARERVADRLGELALLADERELCPQPGLEFGDDRKCLWGDVEGSPFSNRDEAES